jgi:thiamine pyrophosphate-dependent acetolactate synthase large subunit-like protein
MNVRDAFYEVLRTHGITTIFGNPGSNELPMLSDLPLIFRLSFMPKWSRSRGILTGP